MYYIYFYIYIYSIYDRFNVYINKADVFSVDISDIKFLIFNINENEDENLIKNQFREIKRFIINNIPNTVEENLVDKYHICADKLYIFDIHFICKYLKNIYIVND